jgi:hypothetical protein
MPVPSMQPCASEQESQLAEGLTCPLPYCAHVSAWYSNHASLSKKKRVQSLRSWQKLCSVFGGLGTHLRHSRDIAPFLAA